MNWNFLTGNFLLRLPNAEHDQLALFELLQQPRVAEHIPAAALVTNAQVEDELRRIAQRFQLREAAFWLIENEQDQLVGRISIQHISWLQRNAQLQWELSEQLGLTELQQILPKLLEFCFSQLGLHRLEMRLRPEAERHAALLQALGFVQEGQLPAQLEYQGQSIDLALWSCLASAA